MDILIDFANFIISAPGDIGNTIISILPNSPLRWTVSADSQILSWINWLIPIGEMIVIAERNSNYSFQVYYLFKKRDY